MSDLKKITLENSKQEYLHSRGEILHQVKSYELKLSGIKEISEDNLTEIKLILKDAAKIAKTHGEARLRYTNAIKAYIEDRIAEERNDLELLNKYISEVRVKLDNYVLEQVRLADERKKKAEQEAKRNAEIEAVKIKLKLNFDISVTNAIHNQRTLIAETFNKLTLEEFDARISNLPSYKPKFKQELFIEKISAIPVLYLSTDELEGMVREFIAENTFTMWVDQVLAGVESIKKEYVSQASDRKDFLLKQTELIKKEAEANTIKEYEAKKEAEIKISEAKINENIKVQVVTQSISTPSVRTTRKVKASKDSDWNKIIGFYIDDHGIDNTHIQTIVNYLLKKNEPKVDGVTYFNDVKANLNGKK